MKKPATHAAAWHLLRLAIGVTIVTVLLLRYDAAGVIEAIAAADRADLAWAWVYALLGIACFAVAYRLALRPLAMPLGTARIFKILLEVRFYGLFLPGGTNAVVKWHKLSQPGKQPAQSLALVAFTRAAMTFTLLLLVIAGMWADPGFHWPGLRSLALALLAVTIIFLLLCTSERAVARMRGVLGPAWRRLPVSARLREKVSKLMRFLTAFGRLGPLEIGGVMVATLAGNVLETMQHVHIMHAVGIDVSFAMMAWARGILIVCAMLPVSLAGLGLREVSMIAILTAYGHGPEDAMAYSLLAFGVFIVGKGLIGGALELWDWCRAEP